MRNRTKAVGVLLMSLVGVGFIVAGIYQWHISRRLAAEGRLATGTVINKGFERRSKGGKSHYLEVQYQTDTGQPLLKRAPVSSLRFEEVRVGATIPLRYLPDDPAVFALGTNIKPDFFSALLGLLFLVIALVYHLFGSVRQCGATG